jgi:hypothetical protein
VRREAAIGRDGAGNVSSSCGVAFVNRTKQMIKLALKTRPSQYFEGGQSIAWACTTRAKPETSRIGYPFSSRREVAEGGVGRDQFHISGRRR